jgi:hypothetical protein
MPGKTSTPIGPHTAPASLYLRLLRGGSVMGRAPLADTDAPVSVSPQMAGGACGGQMMAGRSEDPALVHF